MERIKVSANFFLDEYIPKDIYLAAKDPRELIYLVKQELYDADQKLRYAFGPCVINNWWDGGDRIYSGYRPEDCPIGADKSDHKKGMASDKLFKHVDAETVRNYIRNNWRELGISKIETGTSWVHSSVAYTGLNTLQQFKP